MEKYAGRRFIHMEAAPVSVTQGEDENLYEEKGKKLRQENRKRN